MSTRTGITILGTAIGFAFGAPQLGFLAGSLIGGIVDPVKVYGPRQGDAKGMFAREGVPIPFGEGIFRCDGTLMACQPGDATEHEHEEGGKGGQPEQITYTYTRTFAVLICESLSVNGIAGVRRVWENEKLVYDATPAPTQGNDDLSFAELLAAWVKGQAASADFLENTVFYLGSETQMPDAELEALFGAGEVEAYRGLAYMRRKDADVTAFGKAVPQYSFEVATATEIQATDLVGHWKLNDAAPSGTAFDSSPTANHGDYVPEIGLSGPITASSLAGATCVGEGGGYVAANGPASVGDTTNWSVACSFNYNIANTGTQNKDIFANWNSKVFGRANFLISLTPTLELFGSYSEAGSFTAHGVADPTTITAGVTYRVMMVRDGSTLNLYVNGVLVDTASVPAGTVAVSGGQTHFGNGPDVDSPTNHHFGGVISDCMAWTGAKSAGEAAADFVKFRPLTGGEVAIPGSDYTVTPEGEVLAPDSVDTSLYPLAVPLGQAIITLCTRESILTEDDIDVTGVPDFNMIGWMIARQANIDACLRPMLDAGFCTSYEADGKIVFVALGAASVVTITADDLVAREGPPVKELRAQEVERPRKVSVSYSDPKTYFVPTTQTDERLTSDVKAVGERTLEIPSVVLNRDQARQIAHKMNKVAWVDLMGGKDFALPCNFSYLTPADIVKLDYRGRIERLRIERSDEENFSQALITRQDRQSAFTSAKLGVGPDTDNYPSTLAGPTMGALLDVRPLRDQDDKVGFYVAACGLLSEWNGCRFQVSADPTAGYPVSEDITLPSIMGVLTAALPAAPAETPDESNTITVQLYGGADGGTLSSVTFDQLLMEANAFALVGEDTSGRRVMEVCQFQTATLVSPGVYALTILIRGRLGTEPVEHLAGTQLVMLQNVHFVECDRSWIGRTLTCRPVSLGTVDADNDTFTADFDGMIQKEQPAVAFNGTRDGSDNVDVSWVGVGRLGTAYQAFHGVHFSGYRITFSDGVDTFTKEATAQSYAYTAAAQTTDFGSPPTSLTVNIFQMNTITGASEALTGTV